MVLKMEVGAVYKKRSRTRVLSGVWGGGCGGRGEGPQVGL